MYTFTFNKEPIKLGSYDQKYGQSWWGEVNEDLKPVKFNTMDQNAAFKAGDTISCEESTNKRSTKGKDYLQLKKVQLVPNFGQSQPQGPQMPQAMNPAEAYMPGQELTKWTIHQSAPDASMQGQLNRIESKLDQLLGTDERLMNEVEPVKPASGWEAARTLLKPQTELEITNEYGDEDTPDY